MTHAWLPNPAKRESVALRALRVQMLVNLTDANSECSHGALPLDRNKPTGCDCWPPDATAALAYRQQDVA